MKSSSVSISLKESAVRIGTDILTIVIGLLCGFFNSYTAFYIAVLVQAVNNGYEAGSSLEGYDKFNTFFFFISFLSSLAAFVSSVCYFALPQQFGSLLSGIPAVIIMASMLSIPVLHMLVDVFIRIAQGNY